MTGERRCGARRHKTAWQQASLCRKQGSLDEHEEEAFKALGVRITFDGHFTKELTEREVSAWRRLYALRQLLCDNNVALKYRLRLLTTCVVTSMYWYGGSWILTRTQCAHLRAVQDRWPRHARTCSPVAHASTREPRCNNGSGIAKSSVTSRQHFCGRCVKLPGVLLVFRDSRSKPMAST